MPTLTPNSGALVLVTGANGFVATHVIRELLEHGYRVRGTVRSDAKATHLRKVFAGHGDRLGFAIVKDIKNDGAFDEAVKGVDAIEHIAAAVHYSFTTPQEAIEPAVEGVKGIINSVLNYGPTVKRIVVTSSGAAIVHDAPEPLIFSEKDWNDQAVEQCARLGHEASPIAMYRASKTLAERAAWDLYNVQKADGKWDLVTINPNYIFGPIINEVTTPESLNSSMLWLYEAVVKGTRGPEVLLTGSGWVDVRDLATAHRLALEKSDAGGERIIVNSGSYFWQDWLDAANAVSSPYNNLPKAKPGSQDGLPHKLSFDASKAARILGLGSDIPYRTKLETIRDILEDFAARGWGL